MALHCLVDSDCRLSLLPDFNSLYCVNRNWQKLKKPGSPCNLPQECASYSFYGPLACSAQCKTSNDCNSNIIEKTVFCCKAIPITGACNQERPGTLSGCSSSHLCETTNLGGVCSDKKEKSWQLGVFLSIFGNCLINLGINFQKKSYKKSNIRIFTYTVRTMVFGSIIYAIGKITSFLAYIFGSQSLLAGLSATGLISNSIFAPLINHEIFTWNDAAAILLVCVGSFIIISNTSHAHIIHSLCELKKMYKQTGTILWFIFILISIFILFLVIKFVEINSDWNVGNESFGFLRTNIFFDSEGVVCKYLMVLAYVFLSSFIASFTTLSAKSLGEIIDKSLGGDNLLWNYEPYLFFFTLVLCTVMQIYWLNRALKHYDALLVIPIFHVSWTILSILTAIICFQDFDHYSSRQIKYFISGIIVIFFGSFFLGLRIRNRNELNSRQANITERPLRENQKNS